MKAHRIILLAVISSLLTSCGAPIVQRALNVPGGIVRSVTGPIFGALR